MGPPMRNCASEIALRLSGTTKIILATQYARALSETSRPLHFRGRRECRMRAAPAVSCATCTKNMHMSIQGSGEHPTSPAQWLYGLWRALPGEQLFCLRSALGNRTSPRSIDASTATSGPHAFAVRFSTCRLRHLHVHRIPAPRFDDRERPSEWDGIDIPITRTLFLVKRNIEKYF